MIRVNEAPETRKPPNNNMREKIAIAAVENADKRLKEVDKLDFAIAAIADYDNGLTTGFKDGAEWMNELLTIGNHHDMDTPPMIDITEEMRSVGAIIYARPEDIDSGMKQPRYSFMQFGDQRQTIKQQLKAVLMANGMYAGSSKAAKILRELADEWDD